MAPMPLFQRLISKFFWKSVKAGPNRIAGFTLVELLVVVAILAILSAIGFLALSGYTQDASRSAAQAKIRMLATAVSTESARSSRSVRSYVFPRVPDMELMDASIFSTPLVAGSYGDADTNYTVGLPDYAALKINPDKYRSSLRVIDVSYADSPIFLAATDIAESSAAGRSRERSYFQISQQIGSGEWFVTWNLPVDDDTTGLFHDPEQTDDLSATIANAVTTGVSDITIPPVVTDIAAWWNSTCATSVAGTNYCWGYNYDGELGIGTNLDVSFPTPIPALSGATIRANYTHGCAITASGGVKCWGANAYGQLGNGSTVNSNAPVDVSGISTGTTELSLGQNHTCAIVSGTVKCWGYGASGRLGNGATSNSSVPVTVNLGETATAIASGNAFSCAITVSGGVKCWGNSNYGQIGNGTNVTTQSTPVAVTGLSSGVTKISATYTHICALMSGGTVKCWGRNSNGQLGSGNTNDASVPVDVVGISGIRDVSAGYYQTCVLTNGGWMKCWGHNGYGQLWNPSSLSVQTSPTDVVGLASGVAKISSGGSHTCALMANGVMKCWGGSTYGQLGNKVSTSSKVPLDHPYVNSWAVSVSLGGSHACIVTPAGGAKCWWGNAYGQLGNASTDTLSVVPVDVVGLASGVAMVSAGANHSCALTTSGGVKCWGYNFYGQLWNSSTGTVVSVPVDVGGLTSGVASISAWAHTTCAVLTTGELRCWGRNNYGQVGDGTTVDKTVPMTVSGASSGVSSVSVWGGHACLRTTDGAGKCWGHNAYYQLGDSTKTTRKTPVSVTGATANVAQIYAGNNYYTCFLTTSGEVRCLWRNNYWQIGNGTMSDSSSPVTVSGLASGVTALSVGNGHVCAKLSTGGAKCWWYGNNGQLGNGSTASSAVPVEPVGLSSGVLSIATGMTGNYSCSLHSGGALKCWGTNSSGQLGKEAATPVPGDVTNW